MAASPNPQNLKRTKAGSMRQKFQRITQKNVPNMGSYLQSFKRPSMDHVRSHSQTEQINYELPDHGVSLAFDKKIMTTHAEDLGQSEQTPIE